MTELFNRGITSIIGKDKYLLFEVLSFLLNHQLSVGLKCEELDNC